MDTAIRVQNLDGTIFISHSANTLGKGMNQTILLPDVCKIVGHAGLFSFGMATSVGEGKL